MNTLTKILIILTIFITTLTHITLSSSTPTSDFQEYEVDNFVTKSPLGVGRFLAQQPTAGLVKCNINPRLCRAKGSPGPDCCKKKCVNVHTDKQNCGLCGKKCKNMEICCNGSCLNPMVNKRHCGGCNNVCNRGDSCVRGMCSYA